MPMLFKESVMGLSVGLIIPTLNAEKEIGSLIESILDQTIVPDKIIIVDSSSNDRTVQIASSYSEVCVRSIERKDFNHGLTRDKFLREIDCDIVCYLTQDAIPADDRLIEQLIRPLMEDSSIVISSGRQLPKEDARRYEQLVRQFNYPDESFVRSLDDLPRLGIKTYFTTDVCAAYRSKVYCELGGFGKTNVNEDMLMAIKAINAGWKIAYSSKAQVFHSHNLTFKQQYSRNYEIGSFLEGHASLLSDVSEIGEGRRLFKFVLKELIREKRFAEMSAFFLDCVARILGNRAGRRSVGKNER